MTPRAPFLILPLLALLAPAPATAAPVSRSVELQLSAFVHGSNGQHLVFTLAATISVDESEGKLIVPPGMFHPASLVVPVSGGLPIVTRVNPSNVQLLGGTLSIGGATHQDPDSICPVGGPPPGAPAACNAGGALGGAIGLGGMLKIIGAQERIIFPIPMSPFFGVGGFATSPFVVIGAPWTHGRGTAATPGGYRDVATGTVDPGVGQFLSRDSDLRQRHRQPAAAICDSPMAFAVQVPRRPGSPPVHH